MRRLSGFRRKDEETGPYLAETIAESMWRAVGWMCDRRPNAVLQSFEYAYAWCEHHLTRPFSQCKPLQGILVQVKSE